MYLTLSKIILGVTSTSLIASLPHLIIGTLEFFLEIILPGSILTLVSFLTNTFQTLYSLFL